MSYHRPLTRRQLLGAIAATGAVAFLEGCAQAAKTLLPSPSTSVLPTALSSGVDSVIDPLKVESGVVDPFFFTGGYGREFLDNAAKIYNDMHRAGGSSIDIPVKSGERPEEVVRPRFISGKPPDVIYPGDPAFANMLAVEGLLADLSDLMEAPAVGFPGKLFKDTLIPGSQATGLIDNTQRWISLTFSTSGIWYSRSLFEQNKWTFPETWDDMLAFCEEVKNQGKMAPWTYQGQNPGYFDLVLYPLVYRHGGPQAILDIDNLAPKAWLADAVRAAVDDIYQLSSRGYIMKGTAGLTHTQAQTAWLQGKAVFIPVGTYIENEMSGLVPLDFAPVMHAVPGVKNGKGGAKSVRLTGNEPFFVPKAAQHPQAGKEFIRILMGRESARFFAANVHSTSAVVGGSEGIQLTTGGESAAAAVADAAGEVFQYKFNQWYGPLGTEDNNQIGALLSGHATPDDYVNAMQKVADQVAADPDIKKFHRTDVTA